MIPSLNAVELRFSYIVFTHNLPRGQLFCVILRYIQIYSLSSNSPSMQPRMTLNLLVLLPLPPKFWDYRHMLPVYAVLGLKTLALRELSKCSTICVTPPALDVSSLINEVQE